VLERVMAVIGPPAVGKTTLTMRLAESPGCAVFRLREHVPEVILAATAASAERLGWIDDVTIARALRTYFERVVADASVCSVLLDNFPGSATQVRLLLGVLRRLAPACALHAVELVAARRVREGRVLGRRVCHQCEQDPIHDPRIPATAHPSDPQHCAGCGGILHPRRGDAPRLFALRTQRYAEQAIGIRAGFAEAGIVVAQVDGSQPVDRVRTELAALMAARCSLRFLRSHKLEVYDVRHAKSRSDLLCLPTRRVRSGISLASAVVSTSGYFPSRLSLSSIRWNQYRVMSSSWCAARNSRRNVALTKSARLVFPASS
jgi:adenylate kinase family enzyme